MSQKRAWNVYSKTRQNIAIGLLALIVVILGIYALQIRPAKELAWVEEAIAVQPSQKSHPSPEPSTTETPSASTLGRTVSIIGDSTGNGPGEWVDLWAREIGKTRAVTVVYWSEDDWGEPVKLSTRGDELTIWNGSKSGVAGTYGIQNFDKISPKNPDLVIYNLGHNQSANGVVSDIKKMQSLLDKPETPFYVTVQNPAAGDRQVLSKRSADAIRQWAARADFKIVDVESAFENSPAGLTGLLADNVHPNADGSKLWAETAVKALPTGN